MGLHLQAKRTRANCPSQQFQRENILYSSLPHKSLNILRAFLLLNYLWTKLWAELGFLLASFSSASALTHRGEICVQSMSPTATGGALVFGFQPGADQRRAQKLHGHSQRNYFHTLFLWNWGMYVGCSDHPGFTDRQFWVQRHNWFLNMRFPSGEGIPQDFQSIPESPFIS